MIGEDTYAYKRDLPHLAKAGKTYFVTFVTQFRFILSGAARDITLDTCVNEHKQSCWLHAATIMPDHVHLVLTPYAETLSDPLRRIKGGSSYRINRTIGHTGRVWRRESFDHILRSDENLRQKCLYVLENPVRARLVSRWEEYRWNFLAVAG